MIWTWLIFWAIAGIGLAFGQDTTPAVDVLVTPAPESTAYDIKPWVDLAFSVVSTLATIVILPWAAWWIKQKTGASVNVDRGSTIHEAIVNGINYAKLILVGSDGKVLVDVKSAKLKTALDYVTQHVPETLAKVGVSRADLEEMILARVNRMAVADASAQQQSGTTTKPSTVVTTIKATPAPRRTYTRTQGRGKK